MFIYFKNPILRAEETLKIYVFYDTSKKQLLLDKIKF